MFLKQGDTCGDLLLFITIRKVIVSNTNYRGKREKQNCSVGGMDLMILKAHLEIVKHQQEQCSVKRSWYLGLKDRLKCLQCR